MQEALPSLAEEVRRRVMAEHRVPLSSVLLLRKKGLVKVRSCHRIRVLSHLKLWGWSDNEWKGVKNFQPPGVPRLFRRDQGRGA